MKKNSFSEMKTNILRQTEKNIQTLLNITIAKKITS